MLISSTCECTHSIAFHEPEYVPESQRSVIQCGKCSCNKWRADTGTGYGHYDDRMVYCHFCKWNRFCPRGMEEIEFVFRKHLKEVHNKGLLIRVDSFVGRTTDIP